MMTLYEQLMAYRRTDLLELVRLKELHGVSRLPKAALAARLAKHMLSAPVMVRYFQWLRDDEIADLPDTVPMLIAQSEYGERVGEETFRLLREAEKAYQAIDTAEFHRKRKQYSFIYGCLQMLETIYGAAPLDVMLQLTDRAPELEITEEVFLSALSELPGELQHYRLQGGSLWYYDVMEFYEMFLEDQGDVPFYIPARSEIERIARCGWLPDTPGADALCEILQKWQPYTYGSAADTVCLIWKCISAGAEIRDVMEFLENCLDGCMETLSDADKIIFIEPVCQMYENTRLLTCRGFTRKELGISI